MATITNVKTTPITTSPQIVKVNTFTRSLVSMQMTIKPPISLGSGSGSTIEQYWG